MKRHDLAKREWLTRDLFEGDRLDQAVNPFLARVQARVAELQAEARKDASDVPELLKKLAEEQEGVRNIVAYIAKQAQKPTRTCAMIWRRAAHESGG
jgi:predicted  nucleic acid-binding Zn-ribbon protein